jgi:hypothetical protein
MFDVRKKKTLYVFTALRFLNFKEKRDDIGKGRNAQASAKKMA